MQNLCTTLVIQHYQCQRLPQDCSHFKTCFQILKHFTCRVGRVIGFICTNLNERFRQYACNCFICDLSRTLLASYEVKLYTALIMQHWAVSTTEINARIPRNCPVYTKTHLYRIQSFTTTFNCKCDYFSL